VAKLLVAEDGEDLDAGRSTRPKQTPPDMTFDYEGLEVFMVHVSETGLPGNGITLVMRRTGFVEWMLMRVLLLGGEKRTDLSPGQTLSHFAS
jgi:hypothetical protein